MSRSDRRAESEDGEIVDTLSSRTATRAATSPDKVGPRPTGSTLWIYRTPLLNLQLAHRKNALHNRQCSLRYLQGQKQLSGHIRPAQDGRLCLARRLSSSRAFEATPEMTATTMK